MTDRTMRQIVPLVKLPPSEWRIKDVGPDHIGISVYARMLDGVPVRHWQKWSILDFPNDLIGIEDLQRAGLIGRYIAAIEQAEIEAAAMKARFAPAVREGNDSRPFDHGVGSSLRHHATFSAQARLPAPPRRVG